MSRDVDRQLRTLIVDASQEKGRLLFAYNRCKPWQFIKKRKIEDEIAFINTVLISCFHELKNPD